MMTILAGIGTASFMFAMFVLFYWRPDVALETRLIIAGIYLIIATVAEVGVTIRLKLEFPSR
jgi:hypothetical protein